MKAIKVRKYPPESEVIMRQAQFELEGMTHEELLDTSKRSLPILSQLTHYCRELKRSLSEEGYKVEGLRGKIVHCP